MEMTFNTRVQSPASSTPNGLWARFKHAVREANEIRAMAAGAARYYSF